MLYGQTQYRVAITARGDSIAFLRGKFSENERFWIRSLDVTSDAERRALIAEIEAKWEGILSLIHI